LANTSQSNEGRPLTHHEEELVRWMLEHGEPSAAQLLPQVTDARVISACPCGCASVDFAIGGIAPPVTEGLQIQSDYFWEDEEGRNFGVFVFARNDQLGGLEVWSVDGQATPAKLPPIDRLKSYPL